jgi:hypothetical protein
MVDHGKEYHGRYRYHTYLSHGIDGQFRQIPYFHLQADYLIVSQETIGQSQNFHLLGRQSENKLRKSGGISDC